MKIKLSDYFTKDFRSAYLFNNNKGRRCVELVAKDSTKAHPKKRFISYAKYLWISANKKEIPYGYEVDHIDGNPRNDCIENLQLLSKTENIQKQWIQNPGHDKIKLICPVCGKTFYREYRFRNRVKQGITCCSNECKSKLPHNNPRSKKVKAVNLITGEVRIYDSTNQTKRDGFTQNHVSRCCNGLAIQHKGWKFSYIN